MAFKQGYTNDLFLKNVPIISPLFIIKMHVINTVSSFACPCINTVREIPLYTTRTIDTQLLLHKSFPAFV